MGTTEATRTRFIEPGPVAIVRATDLGTVEVQKLGNLYLLTDALGDVASDARGLGLYDGDTRILSCAQLWIDGARPVLLQAAAGGTFRGMVRMTNTSGERPTDERRTDEEAHPLDELVGRTLDISRERVLARGALEERLRIVNHGERDVTVRVELGLGADAADIFEVRGYPRPARGTLRPVAVTPTRATFAYDGLDARRRSTYIAFSEAATTVGPASDAAGVRPPNGASVVFGWEMAIARGEAADVRWTVWSELSGPDGSSRAGEATVAEPFADPPRVSADYGAAADASWRRGLTTIETDHPLLSRIVRRSEADLGLLMNEGPGPGDRYMAAGVPWFTTLFGRDALITAFQTLAVRPQLAVETLTVLASLQATEHDDRRDAEPGKILHELRTGELARTGELPHTPYYGSIDSTPLWLMLLGATFDWTGDRGLVDRLWPNVLAALDWIDRSGDRDSDGLVEYERRSPDGLLHQGWKDSSDAIRDQSGRRARGPIALAEVQGYVFDAKRRIAGLARSRNETALAGRLDREAEVLRRRFEEAFWSNDLGCYVLALDGDKRPVGALGSNAGHCLWSGIVDPERARIVADALVSPAMFTGWGIRTYAAGQDGYNPIGYHTGSVWPHDTAIAAAGLRRYGLDDAASRVADAIFDAAGRFPDARLPELFCGFDREAEAGPVAYPVACSPQAWAAGSPFLLLQTVLGLRARSDRGVLEVERPSLPAGVGHVRLVGLRVGAAVIDLEFRRDGRDTPVEVTRTDGDLTVTIAA